MFDPAQFLTHRDRLPPESFDWGTLQWLASGKLLPGATQTLGLCHLWPGKKNPAHYHPNCEELLYVLSGQGRHSLDGRWVELKAGMTIRIATGVRHKLVNEGWEPLTCLIAFSSGDRQTVFLE